MFCEFQVTQESGLYIYTCPKCGKVLKAKIPRTFQYKCSASQCPLEEQLTQHSYAERVEICGSCGMLDMVDGRMFCKMYDDNKSEHWNCAKSKSGRFYARLFNKEVTCYKW